jgi:YfiH family protein
VIHPEWPAPGNVVAGTTLVDTPAGALPAGALPAGLAMLNQVHGSRVVSIDVVLASAQPPDADAVTAYTAGHVCAVRTADCLPVLFCTRDGSEIAAAHAGWRGLAAGVLENTVAALNSGPTELLAWFGPAISQPNFEVGNEVREAFMEHDREAAQCFTANERGRWQADLYALGRQRLAAAGVPRVFGGGWCTFGDPARFHSYRRDPDCGRMVSFIALK